VPSRLFIRSISVAVAGACLAACAPGERQWSIIETVEGGDVAVVVEFSPSETTPGMADVRVRAGEGPDNVLYEGSIADVDGNISVRNIRPDARRPGHLWMCLNGPGQQDLVVRIDLATGLVIEEQRFCAE
jgi:hypothetical protein